MDVKRLGIRGSVADGESYSGRETDELAERVGGEQVHIIQGDDPVMRREGLEIARAGGQWTEGRGTWIDEAFKHSGYGGFDR